MRADDDDDDDVFRGDAFLQRGAAANDGILRDVGRWSGAKARAV